jgi:hypothetical protein
MMSAAHIFSNIYFNNINNSLNSMGFSLVKEIKIGDFITAFAILLSLVSLLISLREDRRLLKREQADRVRNAAARTLAKLDRWKEISLLMFAQMDIVFVDTSKLWAKGERGETLRDELWERLDRVRVKSLKSITKEEIETAYQDLYSFDPYVRDYFEKLLNLLKDEEEVMFRLALLPGVQNILDEMERMNCNRQTATFRNPLMEHSTAIKGVYESRLNRLLAEVSGRLLELIGKKDNEILSRNWLDFKFIIILLSQRLKSIGGKDNKITTKSKHYFKNIEINIKPATADDYGIITKKKTAFIRPVELDDESVGPKD